jgi:hypothetical protein
MKRDYFYTSPLGRRLFRLDLGRLQLALLGSPDHDLLGGLLKERGAGFPLARDILEFKGVEFSALLGADAPADEPPPERVIEAAAPPLAMPPPEPEPEHAPLAVVKALTPAALILDEAAQISGRRKNGQGRAISALAAKLGVGEATIARARRVLEFADEQTIALVRSGALSINRAARMARANNGA